MTKRNLPVAERFNLMVDIRGADECWPWQGDCDDAGYGRFWLGGVRSTHRVAYELAFGSIPAGLLIRHSCDNPPCVNPAHLLSGTHLDNMADRRDRGRNHDRRGRLNSRAVLVEAAVLEIRERRAAGEEAKYIAADFGVTRETVYAIASRRIWGWL